MIHRVIKRGLFAIIELYIVSDALTELHVKLRRRK